MNEDFSPFGTNEHSDESRDVQEPVATPVFDFAANDDTEPVDAVTAETPLSFDEAAPVAPPAPTPWWSASSTSATATAPAPASALGTTPPPAPLPPTPAPSSVAVAPRSGRAVLVGAISGALVGALVTGGLFVAFRDDDSSTTNSTSNPVSLSSTNGSSKSSPATIAPTKSGDVDVKAVVGRISPAVVTIKVVTGSGTGGGSGFIVGSNGTIVTNAHVVDGAQQITVTLSDGDQVPATVKGTDVGHDLAVITIDRDNLPTASLGDSDQMAVGDGVVAIGNALGLGVSVTTGIVSAVDRDINEPNNQLIQGALQTDAAINPGNSGGPLVNSRGEVIGINTAIASPTESNNVGFAISISSAKPIIEALAAGRTAKDAFLGVGTDDVTPSLVQEKNLKVDVGAYVTEVREGSAAERAGIVVGDVVVRLGGTEVTGREQLRRLIRRNPAGSTVKVEVVTKSGDRKSFDIELGELPAA